MYVKIKSISQGSYHIEKINNFDIHALMDGSDIGDGYEITKVEMTDEEFEKLKDFEGF